MTTKYGNEDYTPAEYKVSTKDAGRGTFVGVIVNAKTDVILHGCRHKHDTKKLATECIREMMRANNWQINIIN